MKFNIVGFFLALIVYIYLHDFDYLYYDIYFNIRIF